VDTFSPVSVVDGTTLLDVVDGTTLLDVVDGTTLLDVVDGNACWCRGRVLRQGVGCGDRQGLLPELICQPLQG
jgi:hypothetical protein